MGALPLMNSDWMAIDMRARHLTSVATAALLLGAGTLAASGTQGAAAATTPVTVTVNTRAGLARMPTTGLGINDAVWDSQLGTAQTSDLLKAAGVKMIRYPG